jgi:hypothetical protein
VVMRDQIIKILKSRIRTAQIADDIEPHVINAEAVADEICAALPSGTGAAQPDAASRVTRAIDDTEYANDLMVDLAEAMSDRSTQLEIAQQWFRKIRDETLRATPPVRGDRDRDAMREACDLLAERTHGNPARSPGHNARLCLESALSLSVQPGAGEREAVREECAKIALSFKYSEETKAVTNGARTYGNDEACEKIAAAILRKRDLLSQAPHSSREGGG